jgi:hypothetical protein
VALFFEVFWMGVILGEMGQVRKVCQSIAFLAPAACMITASATPNINPWVDVAILTAGIGLSSFALAGLVISFLWFLS